MRRFVRNITFLVVLSLVAAACSDDSTGTTTTAATTTTVTTSVTTTTSAPTTTELPTTTTTEPRTAVMPVTVEVAPGFYEETGSDGCVTVSDPYRDITFVHEGTEVVVTTAAGQEIGRASLGSGELAENHGLTTCRFKAEVEGVPLEGPIIYYLAEDDGLTPPGVRERSSIRAILYYPFVCIEDAPGGSPAGWALTMIPAEIYCGATFLPLGKVNLDQYLPDDDYTAAVFVVDDVSGIQVRAPRDGFVTAGVEWRVFQEYAEAWRYVVLTDGGYDTPNVGDHKLIVITLDSGSTDPWGDAVERPVREGQILSTVARSPRELQNLGVSAMALLVIFFKWNGKGNGVDEESLFEAFPYHDRFAPPYP